MNTTSGSVGSEVEASCGGLKLLTHYNKVLFFVKHPLLVSLAVKSVLVSCALPILENVSVMNKTLLDV